VNRLCRSGCLQDVLEGLERVRPDFAGLHGGCAGDELWQVLLAALTGGCGADKLCKGLPRGSVSVA
jgi:hypothetical protein